MESKEYSQISLESSDATFLSSISITLEEMNEDDVQVDYVAKLRSQRLKIEGLLHDFTIKERELHFMQEELEKQRKINEEIQIYIAYKEKFQNVSSENQKLHSDFCQIQKNCQLLENENQDLLQTNLALENQLSKQLQTLKDKYRSELLNLRQKAKYGNEEVKSLKSRQKNLQKKLSQIEKQNEKYKLELKQFSTNVVYEHEKRKSELANKNQENMYLRMKNNEMEIQLSNLIQNIQIFQQNFHEEKSKMEKNLKQYKKEIKYLRNQLKEKEEKISKIQNQNVYKIEEVQKELSTQKQLNSSYRCLIQELEEKFKGQQTKSSEVQNNMSLYFDEWRQIKRELEDQNERLKLIIKKRDEAEKARRSMMKRERIEIDRLEKIVQKIES